MHILLVILLFIITACDTPMKTRDPYGNTIGTTGSDSSVTDSNTDTSNDDDDSDDDSDDSDDSDDDVTSEDGFESCNTNYQYYGGSPIGYFALCQNTDNETKYKLKMKSSDSSVGTCFVPVHIQSNGNSFKLGPAQCVHNEAAKLYNMTLYKERTENINGVMVIKANALNAYMQCMTAKVDYISAYPNCQYSSACLSAANQYANTVCTNFVNSYRNYYKQISL